MAYQRGDIIRATDFNTFLTSVNNLYGVGNGSRGYGQTAISQAPVSVGGTITSAHWTNLRNMIAACAAHQGTATALLPGTAPLAAGSAITAHESSPPSNNAFDLDTMIANIDANRVIPDVANMTLSTVGTVSRPTAWTTSLVWQVDVTWSTENAARYFFNTGGDIRIALGHPNTSTSQNANWNTILGSGVGVVLFNALASGRTGTAGTTNGDGFYALTDSDSLIFNGTNIGTGVYSSNDVFVQARRLNFAGVNGGNGTGVRFTITLQDQYTSGFGDSVASGTNAVFQALRVTSGLTGVVNPNVTLAFETYT